jgi:hypothetical protein
VIRVAPATPENIGQTAAVNQLGSAGAPRVRYTVAGAFAFAKRSATAVQLTTFHQAAM